MGSYSISLTAEDHGFELRLVEGTFITDTDGISHEHFKTVECLGIITDRNSALQAFDSLNILFATLHNNKLFKEGFEFRIKPLRKNY